MPLIYNSAKPLYQQIKDILETRIRQGVYPTGGKLPSEKALCEEFGVSRITIRQALDILNTMGMTYPVHGKGSFVKESTLDSKLQKVSTFGQTLAQKGYTGFTRISLYRESQADDFDLLLRGKQWNRVSRLSLTGYANGEPVVYYQSVIRAPYGAQMYECAQALEQQDIPFSTFDLYGRIGLQIGGLTQQILAVNADEKVAKALNLAPGDAVLVLESCIMDQDMQPVEYKKGYYRTDKYTFSLDRQL